MRARCAVLVATLFLLLFAPVAAAADGAGLQGTFRGPDGKAIADVSITVSQGGSAIGEAKTDADGKWAISVPEAGNYDVTLDPATLPKTVKLRNVGGEVLKDVVVRRDTMRTVIFPLIAATESQQVATSAPTAGSSGDTATPGPAPEGATGGEALDTKSTSSLFLQLLVESLKFGSIIAITAVGLSLIFGTTGLINFAHGELVTIGAITAFWLSNGPGTLPLVVAAIGAIIAGAAFGSAMELSLWKPLRRRGTGLIQMFIVSIGVSLLLRHLILIAFGSRKKGYIGYTVQEKMVLGPLSIAPRDLAVVILSVALLVGVGLLLQHTRMGKATRAVADNRALSESSGINVDRVILTIWVVGGGLAGLGGVFFGLVQQGVYWDMGFNLLLLMFSGVILGGLGSAYGAVVGSFVVAFIAQVSTIWFPIDLQYAWALLALILVLLVRPQGILGRAQRAG